jgi:hypothetical protein
MGGMARFGNAHHPPPYNSRQHVNALQLPLAHHTRPDLQSPVLSNAKDWQNTSRSDIPTLPDQDILDVMTVV